MEIPFVEYVADDVMKCEVYKLNENEYFEKQPDGRVNVKKITYYTKHVTEDGNIYFMPHNINFNEWSQDLQNPTQYKKKIASNMDLKDIDATGSAILKVNFDGNVFEKIKWIDLEEQIYFSINDVEKIIKGSSHKKLNVLNNDFKELNINEKTIWIRKSSSAKTRFKEILSQVFKNKIKISLTLRLKTDEVVRFKYFPDEDRTLIFKYPNSQSAV